MRTFKNFLLMGLLPILAVVLTGCKETPAVDPEPPTPSIEKDSKIILKKSVVSVSLAGSTDVLLEYTIENPHEGEKISAEASEDWVNGFSYSITNVLKFDVDANPTDAPRECVVTVKYRYAEDVQFTVKQGAKISAGFELENITADYFTYTVDVIPEDKTTPYIVMSAAPEYILASEFETGEDYYNDDVAYFGWLGQFYGMSALDVMLDRAKVGDERGVTANKGASGVPYTFYCYYIDAASGALISDVHFFTVWTDKPELQDVTFNMDYEVEGSLVRANITPVGYDGDYYFDVLPAALVESYIRDFDFLPTPERTIEYWWSVSVQDMMQDMSAAEIIAAYTCAGNNPDGTPKSYYEFELLANYEYYLFAYTMEENGLCSSTPNVVKFTTGDVAPSDNVITPSVYNITPQTATITFVPSNSDYYVAGWETAADWATFGSTDAERQAYLLANNAYELISGSVSMKVRDLLPDTDYVLYAFGSRGGVATTDEIFTLEFRTKSGDAGEATISIRDLGYYDCADAAEVPGFEFMTSDYYNGLFLCPVQIDINVDDHNGFWYTWYDWTGRYDEYNEKQYMDGLLWSIDTYGAMTNDQRKSYTLLHNDGRFVCVAIVIDKNGQFSDMAYHEVYTSYNGASTDLEALDAWWNGTGVDLQSVAYDDNFLFKAKAQKSLRYSEQMPKTKENVVVGSDEIVASRVR